MLMRGPHQRKKQIRRRPPLIRVIIACTPHSVKGTSMWTDDHENICLTAKYLVRTEGYSAEDLLNFIEKPWRYENEYNEARRAS